MYELIFQMRDWITIKILLDRDKNEISRFQFKEMTTDSADKVLNETEYNEDNSVACKRIYRYFENGSVKEYVEYDPMDELIERHVYHENEDGEIEKVVFEYGDGHKVVKQFGLSELGHADKVTLYDENNVILGYETYVCNEYGEVVERIVLDEEGIETLKLTNTYDNNGNVLEERKIVGGKLAEVTSHAYDSSGKVVRKELKNKSEGYQVVDEYKYDDDGNMVHNTTFKNGTLIFENKCTYDKDNQLLTEEFFEIDFWEKKIARHEKLLHLPKT